LTRLDLNHEFQLLLFKSVLAIVTHFLRTPSMHWVLIVIHVLSAANFVNMYRKYLPFYNKITSTLFGAGWFAYLWLSINVLIIKALEGVKYQGQSIVIVIGVALMYPLASQVRN
jgi:hypothetical protein